MTDRPNLSEALDKLAEMLLSGNPRTNSMAAGLQEAARIKALEEIEIPDHLASALALAEPGNARSGATFLTRPDWIKKRRDLFSFDTSGDPQGGWHRPREGDAELVSALEQFLRAYGEDESRLSGLAATDEARVALARQLDTLDLASEDVLIAVPPFLPEMRLIYVALSDPDGMLPDREGLFYGYQDDKRESWEVESFNYTSNSLHMLNQKFGVRIVGNELCYMRYFLQVVRGEEGAFREIDRTLRDRIVETIDREDPSGKGRAAIEDLFADWHALRCAGAWHSGGLKYDAWLLYGGAIFKARFVVFGNGYVSMIDDTQLCEPITLLREQ